MPPPESAADALLAAAERVLELSLTVQLREPVTGSQGITGRQRHGLPHCMAIKRHNFDSCFAFDTVEVHEAMRRQPRGRVHTCPFGMIELAAPLLWRDRQCGVIFAGQRWGGDGPSPHAAVPPPPSQAWLADRLVMLRGVAHELCLLLYGGETDLPDRRQVITRFMHAHRMEDVSLDDLAAELSLSSSRTRHLVVELFGQSFSQLHMQARLAEASRLLAITDWPIGRIAAAIGMQDQNYFSRRFRQAYGMPPRAYRKHLDSLGG